MPIAATVYPENRQWLGVGRETTAGTAVLPGATVEVLKPQPDEKVTALIDKSLRGSMATDYAYIPGTEVSDFDTGESPAYLDTLGYFLHNCLGDYITTGSTATNSTTLSAPVAAGATTASVTSGTGYAIGQNVQVGVTGDGNPEIVTLTNVSGTTLTFTNTPARYAHASGKATSTVVAPFTHTFSLLNSGTAQPVTHTLTHYQGISGTYGARQYPYFCVSAMDFTMNADALFMQQTKGTSFLSSIAGSNPTNSPSAILAQPNWETKVGIAGAASGGTLVSDVIEAKIAVARTVKPVFTLANQQTPFVIVRNGIEVTGTLSEMATAETPMLNMLNNVQPQLQILVSNGGAGASLLSCQFDFLVAAYETAKLNPQDEMTYDVAFRAIANSTNAGQSGGFSPMKVTIVNAVGTF